MNLTCRLALSIHILRSPGWFAFAARTFPWVVTISRIPVRQAKKSRIPCPNFGESRFPGSSQIPNPAKIFCIFPNPAPYFGQIPDPENTLPDSGLGGDTENSSCDGHILCSWAEICWDLYMSMHKTTERSISYVCEETCILLYMWC